MTEIKNINQQVTDAYRENPIWGKEDLPQIEWRESEDDRDQSKAWADKTQELIDAAEIAAYQRGKSDGWHKGWDACREAAIKAINDLAESVTLKGS